MSGSTIVADASSLIALNQIGRLDLPRRLFSTVVIPPAVAREIAPSVARPPWIVEQALTHAISSQILSARLGPGETEAISLGQELAARWIALDDRSARRFAQRLGLPVIGTVGLLLAAKRHGLLSVIRPDVEELVRLGFRLTPAVVAEVLAIAGEDG